MSVLVTGPTGIVGTHLVRRLVKEKAERVVCLIHNEPFGRFQTESLEGARLFRGDVTDFDSVKTCMARNYVDRVYHLAALTEVKSAHKIPRQVWEVNVMGTVNVLEAARLTGVKRVLVLITDKVYGEAMNATEHAQLQASEPYATSKICSQYAAETYVKTYGMKILMPHSPNVIGFDHGNRIVPNTIKTCLRGSRPKIFVNDKSVREYIYVKDLDICLVNLMDEEWTGSVNIPTGWVYDNEQMVMAILKYFPGLEPERVEVELPPQIQRQTMDSDELRDTLMYDLDEALKETINTFREYREDWE